MLRIQAYHGHGGNIDLAPVRDKTGPARHLDLVEGRSKAAFTDWLSQ